MERERGGEREEDREREEGRGGEREGEREAAQRGERKRDVHTLQTLIRFNREYAQRMDERPADLMKLNLQQQKNLVWIKKRFWLLENVGSKVLFDTEDLYPREHDVLIQKVLSSTWKLTR